MKSILYLIKRNTLLFFRDKGTVFFSILSMLIVILLMLVFLGNMQVDSVLALLETYGGQRDALLDKANAQKLIELWTIAGILVINTVTVSLTAAGVMVEDGAKRRLESFYVTPIGKGKITLSYVGSTLLITTCMCLLTLFVAQLYMVIRGNEFWGLEMTGKAILIILINAVVFSFFMYVLALVVKSMSAWSGLSTVVGTLVGFLGGIYLPMGVIPDKVAEGLTYLPILHGVSLMRKLLTKDILLQTFEGAPVQMIEEYQKEMGIIVEMQGHIINSNYQICFLLGCGIMALVIAVLIQKRKVFLANKK